MAVRTNAVGGSSSVEFFTGLARSRLLALYMAAAFAGAIYLIVAGYGTRFLVALVANLTLLALYVAIVNIATGGSGGRSYPVAHPRLETLVLLMYAVFLAIRATRRLAEFDLTGHLPFYRQMDAAVVGAVQAIVGGLAQGGQAPAGFYSAVSDGFWIFLVPVAMFLAMGYGPAKLGLTVSHWWVALPLILIAALPTILETLGAPVSGLPTLANGALPTMLLAGLGLEFFYRGLLLSRVEAWRGRGLDALAVVGVVFALGQIPGLLATYGFDFTLVGAQTLMFAGAPTSLAWGYLYLRTRSLTPGILWHASPWAAFPFA
ncbi:MAG: CPBP family intramembrane metalloprotease [Dehalococcoidales bacterium]|nr:CPBP family intramembrane metalloprotease [Dehalococcoidales bacterium]